MAHVCEVATAERRRAVMTPGHTGHCKVENAPLCPLSPVQGQSVSQNKRAGMREREREVERWEGGWREEERGGETALWTG